MKLTTRQVALILETPLGKAYRIDDEVVLAERAKISEKYSEFKWQDGFEEASLKARAWWLENWLSQNND